MAPESEGNLRLEVGHVLFIDLVGYSKLLIEEQKAHLRQLTDIVLATAQVREATNEQLVRLPTGDGMALVFRNSAEEPVRCALEIAQALKGNLEIPVRMGIHSGPVSEISDVNSRINIAGAGINMAQRVMDCGDAGHILLSRHVAEDLKQYGHWKRQLHDLGECEVKHGVRLGVVNLYTDDIGNSQFPKKFRAIKKQRTRIRWASIAAAILLLAAIFAAFLIISRKPAQLTFAAPEKSIAVLPFVDLSQKKDQEYFSDGLSEQIINTLSKIPGLFVVARTSTFVFKNKYEDIREVGRRLHVTHVLEGSVSRGGGGVRVDARLIDVISGYQLWSDAFDSNEQDFMSLQDNLAQKVASVLQVKLHLADSRQLAKTVTQDPAAYDLYLRGRYLLEKRTVDSIQKGRALFEKAVKKDPLFALGHSGLADVYILLGEYGEMSSTEASKLAWPEVSLALAIDGGLAEAYVSRGMLLTDFEWNPADAEDDYRKAIELNPNNAAAHHWYAMDLAQLGRFKDALDQILVAQKLDPLAPIIRAARAEILFYARRYDEAIDQCQQALEMEPNFGPAFYILAQAYACQLRFPEAVEAAKKYADVSGDSKTNLVLAYVYAAAGMKAEAEGIVHSATASPGDFSSPYEAATVCSALGDLDGAVDWLQKAIEQRSLLAVCLRIDPRLDNVRLSRRYPELVAKVVPRPSPKP